MKTFVAIGANLGARRATLSRAVGMLGCLPKTNVEKVSPLYETEPVGGPRQPAYLNSVVQIHTGLAPLLLMRKLLSIEKKLGRVRRVKWGPRAIDLDLLAYGEKVFASRRLVVPHPRYHERRFVLVPFCRVAPEFVHPVLRLSNRKLLAKLTVRGQRVTIAAQWNGTRFSPSKKRKRKKSL